MSGKGLCVAMMAVARAGQDENNEVGGQLGRTFISDQSIQGATLFDPIIGSGKGATKGGEYARRAYGETNPGKSTTSAVIEAVLGLAVKVWRKLSMRGGMGDFWAGQPDFPPAPTGKSRQHNFPVSSGAFWRF